MNIRLSLVSVLFLLAFACKKSSQAVEPAPGSSNSSLAEGIIPHGAVIDTLRLNETNQITFQSEYVFEPKRMILKGNWSRESIEGAATYAEDTIPVNELEWELVQTNIRRFKYENLQKQGCGKVSDGLVRSIKISFHTPEKVTNLVIASKSSMPYLCADHYIADETFSAVLNAIKQKLPTPSQSAFKVKAS